MGKVNFYTRVECNGKTYPKLVCGYVNRKRGIGYYKRIDGIWMDGWCAIDLKSGYSAAHAETYKDTQAKLEKNWGKLLTIRAGEDYAKLCAAFEQEKHDNPELLKEGE